MWEEIGAALDQITPALETLRGSEWPAGPVNIRVGLAFALHVAAVGLDWEEYIVTGTSKLFRDFELALHHLGSGASVVRIHNIDPPQPWTRTPR